jgi:hypothetical protein
VPGGRTVARRVADRNRNSNAYPRLAERTQISLDTARRSHPAKHDGFEPALACMQRLLELRGINVTGSDHHPRLDTDLRIEHTLQEALRGGLVASTLDQDVQHATPSKNHLVAASRTASTELACQQRAELAAPQTDGLRTDLDAPLGEQLFDIAVAKRNSGSAAAADVRQVRSRAPRCGAPAPWTTTSSCLREPGVHVYRGFMRRPLDVLNARRRYERRRWRRGHEQHERLVKHQVIQL